MDLACTSWSFPACTLQEAVGIVRALEIGALDLSFLHKPALDRKTLLGSPEALARDLDALEIKPSNLYYLFGDTPEERNLANPETLAANVEDFEKAMIFWVKQRYPRLWSFPGS